MREAISTGASVEEAKEKAIEMLGDIGDADVEFEIIDLPEKKVLGLFGGKDAKVRVFVESLDNDMPKVKENTEKKTEKKVQNKAEKADKKTEKADKKAEKKAEKQTKTDDEKPVTYGVKNVDGLIKYVKDILDHMDIGEVAIAATDIEKGVKLDIEGDGMGAVIGRRGETLDAIQCLASLYCNQEEKGEFRRVVLDTSGYREKREKTLQALATKTARQALRSGRNQSLEPMNPYERRIIHSAVQEIDGVTSWSVSDGKNRRVIIGFEKGSEPAPKARSSRGGRSRNSSRSSTQRNVNTAPAKEPVNELGEGPMYGRIG
ncbi:MAG: KH domain-containing protein [Clostridia bacterium]|nr:KH domain-containing protein [Clostridia bacterium]